MKFLNVGRKPGFLTGLLAFLIAKVSHLLVTFAIGFVIGLFYSFTNNGIITSSAWNFIKLLDSALVGLIYLIAVTPYFYKELQKTK